VQDALTHIALLDAKRDEIRKIAAKHGAPNIRVFGSVARCEAAPDSDFDFLVDAGPVTSSWFPAGLIVDLEQILGRRVEAVTEKGLDPLLRENVLCEATPV
jgi:predicted nucleotidyltransferase